MAKKKKAAAVIFDRIEIQKGTTFKVLEGEYATASFEDKVLYMDANWSIKAKTLVDVQVSQEDRSMLIKSQDKEVNLIMANEADDKAWDRFCRVVRSAFEKYGQEPHTFGNFLNESSKVSLSSPKRKMRKPPGRSRRTGRFGKSSIRSTTKSLDSDIWSNNKLGSSISFSDEEGESRKEEETKEVEEKEKGRDGSDSQDQDMDEVPEVASEEEAIMEIEDDGLVDSDPDTEDVKQKKHRTRRVKKRQKNLFLEDDSDDDLLDKPSLTTPAAQRVVSPGSKSNAKPKTPQRSAALMQSFFKKKAHDNNITKSPRTPVREGSSRLIRSTKRTLEKATTESWLEKSSVATSPMKQSSQRLFGPLSMRTPTKNDDPVEEFSDCSPAKERKRSRISFSSKTMSSAASLPRGNFGSNSIGLKPRKRIMPIQEDEIAEPPAIRNPFRGLKNLGNTCYMNSSLRMLLTAPGFVERLMAIQQAKPSGPLTTSVIQVAEQLATLPASNPSAVNPEDIKSAIDNVTDKFMGFEQRDAHEFLSDLVDHMHDELEKEANPPLPTDDFKLTLEVRLECQSCGYSR